MNWRKEAAEWLEQRAENTEPMERAEVLYDAAEELREDARIFAELRRGVKRIGQFRRVFGLWRLW